MENGYLFFPRQVTAELNQERHIDTPEAWALAAGPKVTIAYDPESCTSSATFGLFGPFVNGHLGGRLSLPAGPIVVPSLL